MNEYVNLVELKTYLGLASQDTQDDTLLLSFIRNASRAIDRYTRRRFYPRRETRFYDYKNTDEVRLDDDLLEVITVRTQNGACTVASAVMYLGTGAEWNRPPYERIVMRSDSGSLFSYSGRTQRANEITAYWGYHEEWSGAWVDTGTSLSINYTQGASSLNFTTGSTGAGASDVQGVAPRFFVGDTLRIGDSFFNITAAGSENTLAVGVPGVNGTSAASVASGTSITKLLPEADIRWSTKRLASWLYGQKDTPYQPKVANRTLGELEIPTSWPPDVRDKLDRFMRRTFEVFPYSQK